MVRFSPKNTLLYDVIIVGGGPSGLMLARQLGPSHVRVLLIDSKDAVDHCHAGIYGCYRFAIDRFGLAKYIHSEHSAVQVYGVKEKTTFSFPAKPFVTVDMSKWAADLRLSCDKMLNTHICRMERTKNGYRVSDDSGARAEGRIVVDCTGHAQAIGSLLGIPKSNSQFMNCAFELKNCTIPQARAHDAGVAYGHAYSNMGPWFYCYSPTQCQFGLGDIIPSIDTPVRHIVERTKIAMQSRTFRGWFKDAVIAKTVVGIGPTMQAHSRLVDDHFLSVGDAAGAGLPATGEGLRFHLEMADLASHLIQEAIASGDCSRRRFLPLETHFRSRYGKSFLCRRLTQEVFQKYLEPDDADAWIRHLNTRVRQSDRFDALYGRMDFGMLLRCFSPRLFLRILRNVVNYHLPRRLRFSHILSMEDYGLSL